MAKKPAGRRRADVEINILESFELRSRRSIRESERKKQTRATRRAEKKAAKLDRKYFAENAPTNPITAVNTIIKAEPKIPFRKRGSVKNALVMAFNAGVIATVALPAYAFSPAVTAISGLTDANTDAQTLSLVRETAVNYERGSYKMMSAEDIQRMTNRNNYLSYKGLTALDYAQSPNYERLTPEDILKVAQKYVGVPYVLGGELPTGLDCSGYTRLVFSEFGVLLPHSVMAQSYDPRVRRIPRSQARPGDLVIMTNLSHQGIYAGNGMFYHAPQRGDRVKLAPIFTDNYYIARVVND